MVVILQKEKFMSEIAETFAALKKLRKKYKAANPKCVKCGNKLSIGRFYDGITTCIKCDTD
jgi:tRNA(Ile2) C34 agmatinyltransferase TiaS